MPPEPPGAGVEVFVGVGGTGVLVACGAVVAVGGMGVADGITGVFVGATAG
jgi:hypothetical protein